MAASGQTPERVRIDIQGHSLDIAVALRDGGVFLIGTDVTERTAAERELVRRATEDELTGLPNHAECVRRMAERLATGDVCVVVADIRSFDFVNDVIGYEARDELLQRLGSRLDADIPDAIVVARTGGDEYTVAMTGSDCDALVGRVRESLEAFVSGETEDAIAVDVRCGVATMAAGGEAGMLFRHADSALQVARRGTRSVVFWDAREAELRRPQHTVTQQLRRALGERTFTLSYQPIIDLHGGEVRRVGGTRPLAGRGRAVCDAGCVRAAGRTARPHRPTDGARA